MNYYQTSYKKSLRRGPLSAMEKITQVEGEVKQYENKFWSAVLDQDWATVRNVIDHLNSRGHSKKAEELVNSLPEHEQAQCDFI